MKRWANWSSRCIVPHDGSERWTKRRDPLFRKEQLASYKVPRKVLFITEDDIDLTGTAKIKPAEARELAARKMAELEAAG